MLQENAASDDFISTSLAETIQVGRMLAKRLKPPVLVLLFGELGTGKTALARGIITGLGLASEAEVSSPTFTLIHTYRGEWTAYHIDLYRLQDAADLESVGLEDIFSEPAIVIVEWPERLRLRTVWPTVQLRLEHIAEGARKITIF